MKVNVAMGVFVGDLGEIVNSLLFSGSQMRLKVLMMVKEVHEIVAVVVVMSSKPRKKRKHLVEA